MKSRPVCRPICGGLKRVKWMLPNCYIFFIRRFFSSLCDNVKCWFNFHLSDIGFMTCTVWWCVELAQGVFLWRCNCCYLSASFARILNGIQTEYKRTRFSIEFLNSKCSIRMVLCIRCNHKMWLFLKSFSDFFCLPFTANVKSRRKLFSI